MIEYIIGAGGGGGKGGGGGHTPVEQPNTLHSRDSVVVLDALCEGEIYGLVNGLKSVYLNDTPIQNANGSFNFLNMQLAMSNGTQAGVSGALMNAVSSDVRSEVSISIKVPYATPVIRRVADLTVDTIDVRVSTPSLSLANTQGDILATAISYTIDINTNGGGWQTAISDSMSGKTTSKYDRTYRLPLTGTGPWDVRITRLTADSTSSLLQNELWFDAITAIISQKLAYPNTALVAIAADARAFQSIPTRTYRIKGLIVRVPTNYDPVNRTYAGLWDGTFKLAWTNNPAWCFYDLVTNSRYGLGGYISAASVDKWGLYAISQYCDGMVPDGFGGTEPRFTLNCYISTRSEAFTVINQIASAFRGMVYWSSGSISAIQDAPADPVALFSAANVIDGVFAYSGASRKAMHTVALVQWNDPNNKFQPAIEYVDDPAAIAIYGVIQTQVAAVGCTSRGQAHRFGQWLLYSEKLEQEVINFKSSLDSAYLRPGQIISVQDAHRVGKRMGGRLASAGNTLTTLTLDASVTIEAGKTYSISVVLPDGTIGKGAVTNAVGSTNIITISLATALLSVPVANAMWVLTASDLSPTLWRVISVSESAKNEYTVTAVAHNPSKFNAIELGTSLQILPTMAIPSAPAIPANIVLTENVVLNLGVAHSSLQVGWDAVQYAAQYRVSWRPVPGNFTDLPTTSVTTVDIMNIPLGLVEVKISAINSLGVAGLSGGGTTTILGTASSSYAAAVPPAAAPAAPVCTAVGGLFSVRLTWNFGDARTDIFNTEVWWSSVDDRAGATRIAQVPFPSAEYLHVALMPGQSCFYWIRVIDTSGNASPWDPLLATGGIAASPSADPSALMTQLGNAIDVAQLSPALGANFQAGNVNGVATVGLSGNMIIDGSFIGRSVAAKTLTADKIDGTNLSVSGSLSGADITGATGTFAGMLTAGTLSSVVYATQVFSPGTYTITVPVGFTSLRLTLVAGGGGGGAGSDITRTGAAGGGGAGQDITAVFNGLIAGTTYTLVVGNYGAGNASYVDYPFAPGYGGNTNSTGANGGNTGIAGLITVSGGVGGGGPFTGAGRGVGGSIGGATAPSTSIGGKGGNSTYGTGGNGGVGSSGVSASGFGAGGGGGGGGGRGIGGNGSPGKAIVEFFNPNGVVLRQEFSDFMARITAFNASQATKGLVQI
jgi:predicted phage tail protein